MRWIVGDVHGMLMPLRTVVQAVRGSDPDAKFYFVGDYVNRGPQSSGVIDFLLAMDDAAFVRGNHDDVLGLILNGTSAVHGDPRRALHWFITQGLDVTLASYGVDLIDALHVAEWPTRAGIQRLCRPVPDAHRKFLQQLPMVIDEDDFFVAHAWYDPDLPDTRPMTASVSFDPLARRRMIWNRYDLADIVSDKAWDRTGYFGHTPIYNYMPQGYDGPRLPVCGPKIVLLDTACAVEPLGRLTAFCHETGKTVQSDREGRLVASDLMTPPAVDPVDAPDVAD